MNKRIANITVLALIAAGTCGWALAQAAKEAAPERAVVPLSNPAKPAKVEVTVMRGSVTVKAYDGKEVIVEARLRERPIDESNLYYKTPAPPAPPAAVSKAAPVPTPAPVAKPDDVRKHTEAELAARQAEQEAERHMAEQERLARKIDREYARAYEAYADAYQSDKSAREEKEKKTAGMKRLSGASSGLEIEEADNVVQINTQSWKAATDLVIQVPRATSLEIRSNMDGAVVVEGISGEIDINNINGPVTVTNVAGNTLVHTVNGDITVVLTRVAGDKPLSFSTMSGDIDITLPADVKAALKMKTDQGEVYTDFDMTIGRSKTARPEAAEKSEAGKYHITFDNSIVGLVNGGGQEMSFTTFGGDIYIRKKK